MARITGPNNGAISQSKEDVYLLNGNIDPGIAASPARVGAQIGEMQSQLGANMQSEGVGAMGAALKKFMSAIQSSQQQTTLDVSKPSTKRQQQQTSGYDNFDPNNFDSSGNLKADPVDTGISDTAQETNGLSQREFKNLNKEYNRAFNTAASNGALQTGIDMLGQAELGLSQRAEKTGNYASAMSKAVNTFNQASANRASQMVDSDGNPNYRSLPNDIESFSTEARNSVQPLLKDPDVASAFESDFSNYTSQQKLHAYSKARSQQSEYINNQLKEFTGSFIGQAVNAETDDQVEFYYGQHQKVLDAALASGAITPLAKEKAENSFNDQVQHTRWRQLINADPDKAQQLLGNETATKHLSPADIEKFQVEAESKQMVMDKKRTALANAKEREVGKMYNEANKIVKNGGSVPGPLKDILTESSKGSAISKSVTELLDKEEKVKAFSLLSEQERIAVLQEIKNRDSVGDHYNEYKTISDNLRTQEDKDLVGLAKSQNIIPEDKIKSIDFSKDLTQQLQERRPLISYLESHYQKETSGLTEEEVSQLALKLNNGNEDERVKLYSQIVLGLGGDSTKVFKQLHDSGNTMGAFAGELAAAGQIDVAKQIFRGQALAKDDKANYTLSAKNLSDLGVNVKYFIPQQQTDTVEAAKSVYAALKQQEGDYSTEPNKDRWDRALAKVTNGGPIDVAGTFQENKIEPPKPGMTSGQFNDWRASLSDSDIARMGGINGVDSATAKDLLQNSTLVQYGRGSYLVQVTQGGSSVFLMDKESGGSRPFVLDYGAWENKDAAAPIKPNTSIDRVKGFVSSVTGLAEKPLDNANAQGFAKILNETKDTGTPQTALKTMASTLLDFSKTAPTLRELISKWTGSDTEPPKNYSLDTKLTDIPDTKTDKYVKVLSSALGIDPDGDLNLKDNKELLGKVISAMIQFENGKNPYDRQTILDAITNKPSQKKKVSND